MVVSVYPQRDQHILISEENNTIDYGDLAKKVLDNLVTLQGLAADEINDAAKFKAKFIDAIGASAPQADILGQIAQDKEYKLDDILAVFVDLGKSEALESPPTSDDFITLDHIEGLEFKTASTDTVVLGGDNYTRLDLTVPQAGSTRGLVLILDSDDDTDNKADTLMLSNGRVFDLQSMSVANPKDRDKANYSADAIRALNEYFTSYHYLSGTGKGNAWGIQYHDRDAAIGLNPANLKAATSPKLIPDDLIDKIATVDISINNPQFNYALADIATLAKIIRKTNFNNTTNDVKDIEAILEKAFKENHILAKVEGLDETQKKVNLVLAIDTMFNAEPASLVDKSQYGGRSRLLASDVQLKQLYTFDPQNLPKLNRAEDWSYFLERYLNNGDNIARLRGLSTKAVTYFQGNAREIKTKIDSLQPLNYPDMIKLAGILHYTALVPKAEYANKAETIVNALNSDMQSGIGARVVEGINGAYPYPSIQDNIKGVLQARDIIAGTTIKVDGVDVKVAQGLIDNAAAVDELSKWEYHFTTGSGSSVEDALKFLQGAHDDAAKPGASIVAATDELTPYLIVELASQIRANRGLETEKGLSTGLAESSFMSLEQAPDLKANELHFELNFFAKNQEFMQNLPKFFDGEAVNGHRGLNFITIGFGDAAKMRGLQKLYSDNPRRLTEQFQEPSSGKAVEKLHVFLYRNRATLRTQYPALYHPIPKETLTTKEISSLIPDGLSLKRHIDLDALTNRENLELVPAEQQAQFVKLADLIEILDIDLAALATAAKSKNADDNDFKTALIETMKQHIQEFLADRRHGGDISDSDSNSFDAIMTANRINMDADYETASIEELDMLIRQFMENLYILNKAVDSTRKEGAKNDT